MTEQQIKDMQEKVGTEPDGVYVNGRCVLVDDVDVSLLSRFRWNIDSKGYVYRHRIVNGVDKPVRLHREIMKAGIGVVVDHRNRNKLDNRRGNLRLCSQAQNTWNSTKKESNTSGFKGVDFVKEKGRYRARIRVGDKRINLGYFDDAKSAGDAYSEAAVLHHQQFCRL